MLNPTGNIFFVISALEAAVIIIGNTFTIFIFWTQGFHLKRTCFLLINLAVADLLVGIAEPIILGTERRAKNARNTTDGKEEVVIAFQVLGSSTSVLGSSTSVIFLALISLERVHAVLRPLRHRATSTRVYIYSIVIVWTAGICMIGITFLPIYPTDKVRVYGIVIIHSFLFICVLVICACYLAIRTRLRSTTPEILDVHNRKSTEQNLRLSRTFFIVAAVSLVFWMPAIIVYSIRQFCKRCVSPTVEMFVKVLHLANSMVNPFVYSFRMPIFKDALKKCWRKRRQNIKIRAIPGNGHNAQIETRL